MSIKLLNYMKIRDNNFDISRDSTVINNNILRERNEK